MNQPQFCSHENRAVSPGTNAGRESSASGRRARLAAVSATRPLGRRCRSTDCRSAPAARFASTYPPSFQHNFARSCSTAGDSTVMCSCAVTKMKRAVRYLTLVSQASVIDFTGNSTNIPQPPGWFNNVQVACHRHGSGNPRRYSAPGTFAFLLPPAPPSAEVRAALVPLMSRPPVSMRASRLAPHRQSPPHVEPISSCASLKSTVSPHRCANPSGRSQHSRRHSKAQRPRAPRPLIGALQRVPFETVRDRMLAGVRASSRSNEPNPARIVARRAPYLRHAPNGSSADRVRPWGWLR